MFLKNTICETAYLQRKLPLEAFKNYIMSFKDNLNANGIIIMGYIYTILNECYSNGIFNKEIRDEVFPLDEFNYYYFKSITTFLCGSSPILYVFILSFSCNFVCITFLS